MIIIIIAFLTVCFINHKFNSYQVCLMLNLFWFVTKIIVIYCLHYLVYITSTYVDFNILGLKNKALDAILSTMEISIHLNAVV
jgi:hypothetical protein